MQESQVFAEWKRFTHGLPTEGVVRPVILDSWTRCLRAGVSAEPAHVTLRRVREADLRQRLEENRELIEVTQRHLRVISSFLEPLAHVVYLVDREGIVLYAQGSDPDSMQDLGLLPGFDWSEHTMGTNGAGTALATGQPVMVMMSEHFIQHFHESTCTAAPVHDVNGAVIAAIDVCTARENVTGERLASVAQLASMIEQELSSVRRREGLVRRLQDRCAQTEEALRNQDSRLAQIFQNVCVALYEAELVEPSAGSGSATTLSRSPVFLPDGLPKVPSIGRPDCILTIAIESWTPLPRLSTEGVSVVSIDGSAPTARIGGFSTRRCFNLTPTVRRP